MRITSNTTTRLDAGVTFVEYLVKVARNPGLIKRNPCRPYLGFTLVEMLVVITLIVLLIALLMPALGRTREIGRRTICATHLDQANTGLNSYALDHMGRYPSGNGTIARTTGIDSTYLVWDKQPTGFGFLITHGYADEIGRASCRERV